MNFDKVSYNLYSELFKNIEIENNNYKLNFLNYEKNFYNFALNYFKIIGENITQDLLELSIIFEFLYINQCHFLSIYNGEINESLDLLTFLNININITKILNKKLNKIGCSNYIIDIMNSTRYTDLISSVDFDINNIKKTLIDIFYKIISR